MVLTFTDWRILRTEQLFIDACCIELNKFNCEKNLISNVVINEVWNSWINEIMKFQLRDSDFLFLIGLINELMKL